MLKVNFVCQNLEEPCNRECRGLYHLVASYTVGVGRWRRGGGVACGRVAASLTEGIVPMKLIDQGRKRCKLRDGYLFFMCSLICERLHS